MSRIDSERTIERAHTSEAPPTCAQSGRVGFEGTCGAHADQAESLVDNEAAPTRMTPGGTRTAVGYVRVSKEEETQGYSFDTQRAEIERYCESEGHELVRIYADEGLSARSDRISKRPGLSSLIDHAEQHQFDVVVVQSLGHWARGMRVQAEALQRLVDADVRFVSVAENMDSGTEFGRAFMKVLASFAEFFSNELSRHSRRSFEGGQQA